MKVIGFCGYSGSGKTTLVEQLIGRFRRAGQRVSVVKHAHHDFDIDHPGKDSWRHRQAGAFEVVIASDRRLAKIREYEVAGAADGAPAARRAGRRATGRFVEGFKHADLLKLEVWRAEHRTSRCSTLTIRMWWRSPPTVPDRLPVPTRLPLLDLNDPEAVAAFLMQSASRYEYTFPRRPRLRRASRRC